MPHADLSKAVRPFVAPSVVTSRGRTERGLYFGSGSYTPPATTTDPDNPPPEGTLVWSAQQPSGCTTLGGMGFSIKWPDSDFNFTETGRTTHTVRVENPDDSSQFVDVEVIDNITYRNGKSVNSAYSLNNP